ncbi:MAG: hypothetical protein OXG16_02230 [Rhodospirillales bacterium]|nr:hypothetical protein [Rhodospirillales bacterium]
MDHAGSDQRHGAASEEVDEHGQGQGRQGDDQIIASEMADAFEQVPVDEALTDPPGWLAIAPIPPATTAISGIVRVSSVAFSTNISAGECEFPSAKRLRNSSAHGLNSAKKLTSGCQEHEIERVASGLR